LEREDRVLFRYVDSDGRPAADDDREANPNGSLRAIAGVIAPGGNVAGLMPHPERAAETILGSEDGAGIIRSLVDSAAKAASGGSIAVGAAAGAR
jgi:phosphoribosylformylglycinamidine synthase